MNTLEQTKSENSSVVGRHPKPGAQLEYSAIYRRICIGVLVVYLSIELGLLSGGIAPLGELGRLAESSNKLLQIVAGAFVALLLAAPRGAIGRGRVPLLALGYLCYLVLSIVWSVDSPFSVYIARTSLIPALAAVLLMSVVPIEFTVRALNIVSRVAIVLVAVVVAIDPASRVSQDEGSDVIAVGWSGSFLHKNQMGMVMVLLVLFAYFFEPTRGGKWFVVISGSFLAIASSSVGAVAGLCLAGAAAVSISRLARIPSDRTAGVLALVGLFGMLVIGTLIGVSLEYILPAVGKDLTFTGRTYIWRTCVEFLKERPLLGFGQIFHHGDAASSPESARLFRSVGFVIRSAHNGFFNIAVQYGLIGVAIFSTMFLAVWRQALIRVRTASQYPVALWCAVVVPVLLSMSLSEPIFDKAGIIFVLLAAVFIQRPLEVTNPRLRRRLPSSSSG